MAPPGSQRSLHLVTDDIAAARDEVTARDVQVAEIRHIEDGQSKPRLDPTRCALDFGPRPGPFDPCALPARYGLPVRLTCALLGPPRLSHTPDCDGPRRFPRIGLVCMSRPLNEQRRTRRTREDHHV